MRARDHLELFTDEAALATIARDRKARLGARIAAEIMSDLPDLGSLTPDRDTLDWMLTVAANEVRALQDALEA